MLPPGFGRKQEFQTFTTDITNKEDLNNVDQIVVQNPLLIPRFF